MRAKHNSKIIKRKMSMAAMLNRNREHYFYANRIRIRFRYSISLVLFVLREGRSIWNFFFFWFPQPRNIIFDTATEVKVGRSITRTKIADNNAVFDCKVLSRNHAVIWYRDGKFFLRVSSADAADAANVPERTLIANFFSGHWQQ